MNKRKVLSLAIIALLCALIAGGTSAYFTFSDRSHNIITTSGVAIELIEDTDQIGVDGRPIPFTNVENAMPGDKISKIPRIKNVDEGEVYVRMKLSASVKYASGGEYKISPDLFQFDMNRGWTKDNGYYYYLRTLSSGETSTGLFTAVTIPKTLADKYQGATFSLNIVGEAVQVANNGSNVMEARGWPGE